MTAAITEYLCKLVAAANTIIGKVKLTDGTETALINPDGELLVNATDALLTKTVDYAGAQSGATFLTPTAGKYIEIHNVYVSTASKVVDVLLRFNTSAIDIFKMYTTNAQTAISTDLHIVGAVDEVIQITCAADSFVSVTYHER